MKSHEEILDPYAFDELTYGSANPCKLITQSDALNAMQQAVDQAMALVPVDADNLPNHRVLCLRNKFEMFVGVIYYSQPLKEFVCKSYEMHHSGITHYFDPAKLKTP